MVPDSLDVDTWDGVQTAFSDPYVIAAAIIGALPGVGITSPAVTSSGLHAAIMIAIRFAGGGSDPTFSVPSQGLGPVEFQLNDGSQFIGTSVAQLAEGLVILGRATVPDPIAPPSCTCGRPGVCRDPRLGLCGWSAGLSLQELVFVNEGELALRVCRIEGPADPNFHVTRNWEPPVTIPPGGARGMTIVYTVPRGADVTDMIRVTCNEQTSCAASLSMPADLSRNE